MRTSGSHATSITTMVDSQRALGGLDLRNKYRFGGSASSSEGHHRFDRRTQLQAVPPPKRQITRYSSRRHHHRHHAPKILPLSRYTTYILGTLGKTSDRLRTASTRSLLQHAFDRLCMPSTNKPCTSPRRACGRCSERPAAVSASQGLTTPRPRETRSGSLRKPPSTHTPEFLDGGACEWG